MFFLRKKNNYYIDCYVHNIFTILTQQILCVIQKKKTKTTMCQVVIFKCRFRLELITTAT